MNESEKNINIIKTIFDFSVTCRREGSLAFDELLSLEEEKFFEEPENAFFVALVKAMLEGYDSLQLEELSDKLILENSGGADAKQKEGMVPLSFRIIKRGILLIQQDEEPEKIAGNLLLLVGEDALKEYEPHFEQWKKDGENRLKTLRKKQAQKEAALITDEVKNKILQVDEILVKKEKEFAAALEKAWNEKKGEKKQVSGLMGLCSDKGEIELVLTSSSFPTENDFLGKRGDKILTVDGAINVCNSTMHLFDRAKFLSSNKNLDYFMRVTQNLANFEKRISFELERL